eukprot:Rhum_TRINITY_DN9197_c0_g2::Rhum_TRINITY_DN9197_c0_g2_i1::g.32055::m.32055
MSASPGGQDDGQLDDGLQAALAADARAAGLRVHTLFSMVLSYADLCGSTDLSACAAALRAHDWDAAAACRAYLEDAGMRPPSPGATGAAFVENAAPILCAVCFADAPAGAALALRACGHSFCKECIQAQVEARMGEGDVMVRCLHPGCAAELAHAEVAAAAGDAAVLRLQQRSLERASSVVPTLVACPGADCRYVFCADAAAAAAAAEAAAATGGGGGGGDGGNGEEGGEEPGQAFTCPLCSVQLCAVCGTRWHPGETCAQHKARLGEGADADTSLQEYLKDNENIRPCPQCGEAVEKAFGCDKMKCRCGYRFCFVCLAPNAQCSCSGDNHGFWDNRKGTGDFKNLRGSRGAHPPEASKGWVGGLIARLLRS